MLQSDFDWIQVIDSIQDYVNKSLTQPLNINSTWNYFEMEFDKNQYKLNAIMTKTGATIL